MREGGASATTAPPLRRVRDRRVVIAAAAAVVVGAGALVYPPFALVALAAAGFAAGAYLARARSAVVVAAALAVSIALEPDSWVPLTFTLLAPYLAGLALRERTQLVTALAARTRELEREQETFARLAVQHERARIARELHDIVAHHLAVMVVQAGAGRMAAASDDAARRAERLSGIRAAGGEALGEMARLLDLLEAERDTLPRLLERARAAGLNVRYRGPDDLGDTALRIVQEALTNAVKHAPGADVDIAAGETDVMIRDHGARTPPTLAATGAGLGLEGLRERAAAAGGRLVAGPAPAGGWEVRATLPRTPVGALEDRH